MWRQIKNGMCPQCGRDISQHLYNPELGREEEPSDYSVISVECPASQAISQAQFRWTQQNKDRIRRYHDGEDYDPTAGLSWISQSGIETLPKTWTSADESMNSIQEKRI